MRDGSTLLGGLCVAVLGALGGWFAARQEPAADEPAAEAAAEPALGERTLKNLGVETGPVRLGRFVRARRVQAVVVDPPLNARPLPAPLGGTVQRVHVVPGARVRGGDVVVTLLRDPIPRPETPRVADILAPVGESLHDSLAAYRTANGEVGIVEKEIARLEALNRDGDMPLVAPQRLVDLAYDLVRARQRLENATRELEWHGVEPGDHDHATARLWQRALEHNGLWNANADRVFRALPERLREPWTIAVIGELMAAGLATDELASAIAGDPSLATRFVEVASLLVGGHSVASVRWLAAQGALEPIAELKAPPGDWDVAELDARPGERFETGARLLLLHDPKEMWLELHPAGGEVAILARALADGAEVSATPLLAGAGPTLEGLAVQRLATRGDRGVGRGGTAYVVCPNSALADGDFRSWRLRAGLRYVVAVPEETFEDRFVLPAGAVTDDGPDRVVFRRDGDTFKAVPVHVEYEDSDVVVVANDGAVYPGEPIVLRGAYALALALRDEGGAGGHAHHGHSH